MSELPPKLMSEEEAAAFSSNPDKPQFSIRPQESQKREAHTAPDLIERYKAFARVFSPKADVVYHPASTTDASPSAAFPGSRVLYAEIDEGAVEALREAGYEAYAVPADTTDPRTLGDNPPAAIDVAILLNHSFDERLVREAIAPGGYLLCNEYHNAASNALSDQSFELVGVANQGDLSAIDRENLESYFSEISSEEEWRSAPFSWTEDSYQVAERAIEAVGGDTSRMLEEYRRIVAGAREKKRNERQFEREEIRKLTAKFRENPDEEGSDEAIASMPESENDAGPILLSGGISPIVLNGKLPHKKGTADSIFIFRKLETAGA